MIIANIKSWPEDNAEDNEISITRQHCREKMKRDLPFFYRQTNMKIHDHYRHKNIINK